MAGMFRAGETLTAEKMNTIADQGTYTPTFTASSSNPSVGSDGFLVGGWYRTGNLITSWARVQFGSSGSGADPGSGDYFVSLPFSPDYTIQEPAWSGTTGTAAGLGIGLGTVTSRDNSTLSNATVGSAILVTDDRVAFVSTGSASAWRHGHPFVWDFDDRFAFMVTFVMDPSTL